MEALAPRLEELEVLDVLPDFRMPGPSRSVAVPARDSLVPTLELRADAPQDPRVRAAVEAAARARRDLRREQLRTRR